MTKKQRQAILAALPLKICATHIAGGAQNETETRADGGGENNKYFLTL